MFQKIRKIGLNVFSIIYIFLNICLVDLAVAAEIPPIQQWTVLPWGEISGGIENSWFLNTFLPNLIGWFLGFLATAAIIVIMVGGYMHLTAFGGEQTTKGKETIMYGIIGLLIVILSYAIVSIVQNLDFFI